MDVFEKYSPQFQYFPDISHIHLGVIGIVFRHSRIPSLLVISHYPIKTNHIDSNRVYVNIYIYIHIYIYYMLAIFQYILSYYINDGFKHISLISFPLKMDFWVRHHPTKRSLPATASLRYVGRRFWAVRISTGRSSCASWAPRRSSATAMSGFARGPRGPVGPHGGGPPMVAGRFLLGKP